MPLGDTSTPALSNHPWIDDNVAALEHGLELFERVDASLYPRIGPHVRHVLDHYAAFFDGTRSGTVDYDARRRDPRVETDRTVGLATLRDIRDRLHTLDRDQLERVVPVRSNGHDVAEDFALASLGRELQFLLSHTVHHWALIRTILSSAGVSVSESFGVAPSTLRYRETLAACVPQAG